MSRGRSRSSSSSGSRGMSRSSYSSSRRSYSSPVYRNVVVIGGNSGYSNNHGGTGSFISGVVAGGFLVFLGIIALIFGFTSLVETQKDYESTYATVVSNVIDDGWYYTTYDYFVKGEYYRNKSQEGWEFPAEKGETVLIYYQTSNPNIITEEIPNKSSPTPFLVIGGAFTIIGAIVILSSVHNKKRTKQIAQSDTTISNEPVKQEKVYCSYCGAEIPEGSNKCLNCGAPKK